MKYFYLGILCTVCLFVTSSSSALNINEFTNARNYSMGNTFSILQGFANPASNGFSSIRYFSIQYINRYGVKGLSTWAGEINYPNRYLNTGLYVSRFGMKSFHETLLAVNLYKRLSSHIVLGIRGNYLNLHYSDKESNKSVITADIGIYTCPVEKLYLSVLAINPLCAEIKIGDKKSKMPSLFAVGVAYEISNSFLLTGEVEKQLTLPVKYKIGMEYSPIKELSIRAGMFTSPFTPSFGIGLHLRSFIIDLGFSVHSVLGFYSSCGLQFCF